MHRPTVATGLALVLSACMARQPLPPPDVPHFREVQAGHNFTCALTVSEGAAWCWGSGSHGELGNGRPISSRVIVRVAGGHRFVSLSAGRNHACALTAEGAAWCWGSNASGELGNAQRDGRALEPVRVATDVRFSRISAGHQHTCAITAGGEAWCWGQSTRGELGGIPEGRTTNVPVPVPSSLRFADISAGGWYTCGVTNAGEGYCWGMDFLGQLGSGGGISRACGTLSNCVAEPQRVVGDVQFRAIATGEHITCSVSTAAQVQCWGDAGHGVLGTARPDTVRCNGYQACQAAPRPVRLPALAKEVVVGRNHVCALLADGRAFCWGWNQRGQLGVDMTREETTEPVAVKTRLRFTTLDAGGAHTCGVAGQRVYCWGENSIGERGDGSRLFASPRPVAVTTRPEPSRHPHQKIIAEDERDILFRTGGPINAFVAAPDGSLFAVTNDSLYRALPDDYRRWAAVGAVDVPQYTVVDGYAPSRDVFFALGSGCARVYRWDANDRWRETPTQVRDSTFRGSDYLGCVRLRRIWGRSARDVFIVGSDGVIMHYDGVRWSAEPNPAQAPARGGGPDAQAMTAFVGVGGDTATTYAATWRHVLRRSSQSAWEILTPTQPALPDWCRVDALGVDGRGLVVAGGEAPCVARYENGRWRSYWSQLAGFRHDLHGGGVRFGDALLFWGASGGVVELRGEQLWTYSTGLSHIRGAAIVRDSLYVSGEYGDSSLVFRVPRNRRR